MILCVYIYIYIYIYMYVYIYIYICGALCRDRDHGATPLLLPLVVDEYCVFCFRIGRHPGATLCADGIRNASFYTGRLVMPDPAADVLASILKLVEAGHPWPRPLRAARCAYLAKQEGLGFDPCHIGDG